MFQKFRPATLTLFIVQAIILLLSTVSNERLEAVPLYRVPIFHQNWEIGTNRYQMLDSHSHQ
jgi:hypothetical protein